MTNDIVKDLLMISKIPSTKNLPSRPQIQGTCADAATEITRLRNLIEEAIKMMPHRIPFCDTNMGGECDCTCKPLLDHLRNAL